MKIKIWIVCGVFENAGENPAISVFLDEDFAIQRQDEWDHHEDCLETHRIEFETVKEDDKELARILKVDK